MKPKEFDELIRQKFDQNDFAYKSGNWDSLAEKLEGRAKKRSAIMWWWVPLAGMAASVALAMSSTGLMQHGIIIPKTVKTGIALGNKNAKPAHTAEYKTITATSSHKEVAYAMTNNGISKNVAKQNDDNTSSWFHLNLNEVSLQSANKTNEGFNFLAGNNKAKPENKKSDKVAVKEAYETFVPEEEVVQKAPKVSINLLGGYNSGNSNTGYTLGGTIRRMLNDKVYVESDVAFTSSNNMQATNYVASTASIATRTTNAVSGKPNAQNEQGPETVPVNENYNLYYAQVSPGLGYKIVKRMSVGLGPDFQRMLVDNRPVVSGEYDRNNIQIAPLFDVGFVGKTEYSLTKRFKTTVSYRKGVNNIINPSDKYLDRDYLQFQLRYTIFNK